LGTTGDFEKNTFGDLPLGILKMTIGDSKITHICGLKNTFGDIHLGMQKIHLGMQKNK
jgi:hypothetical protein